MYVTQEKLVKIFFIVVTICIILAIGFFVTGKLPEELFAEKKETEKEGFNDRSDIIVTGHPTIINTASGETIFLFKNVNQEESLIFTDIPDTRVRILAVGGGGGGGYNTSNEMNVNGGGGGGGGGVVEINNFLISGSVTLVINVGKGGVPVDYATTSGTGGSTVATFKNPDGSLSNIPKIIAGGGGGGGFMGQQGSDGSTYGGSGGGNAAGVTTGPSQGITANQNKANSGGVSINNKGNASGGGGAGAAGVNGNAINAGAGGAGYPYSVGDKLYYWGGGGGGGGDKNNDGAPGGAGGGGCSSLKKIGDASGISQASVNGGSNTGGGGAGRSVKIRGEVGYGGSGIFIVIVPKNPNNSSDQKSIYNADGDVQYHDSVEDIQKKHNLADASFGEITILDKDRKMKTLPYVPGAALPTYFQPGTYRYGSSNYVPLYEDSVYLSRTPDIKQLGKPYDSASLKAGFCNDPGALSSDTEAKCNKLDQNTCASVSCCVLFGGSKCVAGDENGPKQKSNYTDPFVINKDVYYYQGKCYGNCTS